MLVAFVVVVVGIDADGRRAWNRREVQMACGLVIWNSFGWTGGGGSDCRCGNVDEGCGGHSLDMLKIALDLGRRLLVYGTFWLVGGGALLQLAILAPLSLLS